MPGNEYQLAGSKREDLHLSIIAQGDKVSFGLSGFLVGYFIYSAFKSSWKKIRCEQRRSDTLLRNILPKKVATRLENKEEPIADYCENVSILFADIVGFSTLSRSFAPEQLVSMLNNLFSRFDALCEKHHLEKIF